MTSVDIEFKTLSKQNNTNISILQSSNESGSFAGYASLFNVTDSDKDIIEPGAFTRTLQAKTADEIRLLWQHKTDEPIGCCKTLQEQTGGLWLEATLLLKIQRAYEAYILLKHRAIIGLSIGFIAKDYYYSEQSIRHITEIDLLEISLVTFPANHRACVSTVKSTTNKNHYITQKETTMSLDEIEQKITSIQNGWETFKDHQTKRLEQIETCMQRPSHHTNKDVSLSPEEIEHKQATLNYMRTGNERLILEHEQKALSAGSNADGGYLLAPTMSNHIIKEVTEKNPLRKISRIQTLGQNSYELLQETGQVACGWVSETQERKTTDTPQINRQSISTHEIYAAPKATQTILDDSFIDIEKWLTTSVADKFAQHEHEAMLLGDGKNKPKGILTYEAGKAYNKIQHVVTKDSNKITIGDINNLFSAMKTYHLTKCYLIMNRGTLYKIRDLYEQSNNNKHAWQPSYDYKKPNYIMGVPIIESDLMPPIEKDKKPIILGNFHEGHLILDRLNHRIMRDPYTDKPYVTFYITKRVGASVINGHAFKILQIKG